MARFDLKLFPGLVDAVGTPLADVFLDRQDPAVTRSLAGGAGNDSYEIDGNDTILEEAGGGIDTVFATAGFNVVLAAEVEDLVLRPLDPPKPGDPAPTSQNALGNDLANRLTGNDLDNLIDGGAGADTMEGGAGNDTYVVDSAGDRILADESGVDVVESRVSFTLGATLEDLELLEAGGRINGVGNALGNTIRGNTFANVISALGGNDSIGGGLGADTLIGGTGDDTYIDVGDGDVVVEGAGGGIDHVYAFSVEYRLAANVENLTIGDPDAQINGPGRIGRGNALSNGIGGNGFDNVLYGLGGDDNIAGGLDLDMTDGFFDADTMVGGEGNDTYEIDSPDDVVMEEANEGIDSVEARWSYELPLWVENLELLAADPTAIDARGNDLANRIDGNGENNFIGGFGGNDTLDGSSGNDTIDAGRGNDVVDGGSGNDSMTGGLGDDSFTVDSLLDVVVEGASGGKDEIRLTASTAGVGDTYVLAAEVETLILAGGGDLQQARGNGSANLIIGAANKDFLDGDAGVDTLIGGTGDDTYVIDTLLDRVIENPDAGKDTLRTTVSINAPLQLNLENIELAGGSNLTARGNAVANLITGNTGTNQLFGEAGNDTLKGGGLADTLSGGLGEDVLDGEAGADSMAGGLGDDTYVVDDAGDVVTEAVGQGFDVVVSGVNVDLSGAAWANVEGLVLTGAAANGIGNDLANSITGTSGGNLLEGRGGNDILHSGAGGADTLRGGSGNDTYYLGSGETGVVEELVGEGRDLVVVLNGNSHTMADNVEDLRWARPGEGTITGNALANQITAGNQNDDIDGGAGADTMMGRGGNDTYAVDNAGDRVIELAGEGIDLVQSDVTFVLGANVENLVLGGGGDINGTGNDLANLLTGNTGANILSGGGGDDELDGGAGADVLRGGTGDDEYLNVTAADTVLELASQGFDVIFTTEATYVLGNHVEGLRKANVASFDATGNALNNEIVGSTLDDTLRGLGGDDLLDGFTGNDNMVGGLGNDTYGVGAVGDVVVELAGQGIDTILTTLTTVALADYANVENVTVTAGDATVTGSAVANLIRTSDGADSLNGGAGADTLQGGRGNDTYGVDSAADRVVELPDQGIDQVNSSVDYTLGAQVENLVLTGSALRGTGNAQDNAITGNGLANILTGGDGNDVLDGAGGADQLLGGNGRDTFVFDALDTRVDGGAGDDRLLIAGAQTVDFTAIADTRFVNLEFVELGSGNNTLTANLADVLALSSTSNRMVVDGSAGDVLNLVDPAGAATWTNAGQDMIGGILYQVYESGLAVVFADTDITVNLL